MELTPLQSESGKTYWLRPPPPGILFQCDLMPVTLLQAVHEQLEKSSKRRRRPKKEESPTSARTVERECLTIRLRRLACFLIVGEGSGKDDFKPVSFSLSPRQGQADVAVLSESDLQEIGGWAQPDLESWVPFITSGDKDFVVETARLSGCLFSDVIFNDPTRAALDIALTEAWLLQQNQRAEDIAEEREREQRMQNLKNGR